MIKSNGFFTTYFHPWEFYNLKAHPEFKTKWIMRNHSGNQLAERLSRFIEAMKGDGCRFITYSQLVEVWERGDKIAK